MRYSSQTFLRPAEIDEIVTTGNRAPTGAASHYATAAQQSASLGCPQRDMLRLWRNIDEEN